MQGCHPLPTLWYPPPLYCLLHGSSPHKYNHDNRIPISKHCYPDRSHLPFVLMQNMDYVAQHCLRGLGDRLRGCPDHSVSSYREFRSRCECEKFLLVAAYLLCGSPAQASRCAARHTAMLTHLNCRDLHPKPLQAPGSHKQLLVLRRLSPM